MNSSDFDSYDEYYEAYDKLEQEFNAKFLGYFDKGWGLGRGLEIPMDWFPIVTNAVATLIEAEPNIKFTQIKEKFNGLRIYYSPYTEELDAIIRIAEHQIYELERKCPVQPSDQ